MSAARIDFEKFRLRPFVERLIGMGEVESMTSRSRSPI